MAWRIEEWDVAKTPWPIEDGSVQCVVTSPPYWGLRDYGVPGQMGLERTPEEYVEKMIAVFREVRRVLRKDGIVWLNLGDCYTGSWGAQSRPNGNDAKSNLEGGSMLSARQIAAHPKGTNTGSLKDTPGLKAKDLVGIPWRVAFALQADGWWLRSDIVWAKPNPMPESVRDRPTRAHEYVFLLTKSARYFYDAEAIKSERFEASIARRERGRENGYHPPGQTEHRGASMLPSDKQRGHSRRHAGFNDRWNAMPREEQIASANARTVWQIATEPFPEAHPATFPTELARRCILAGSKPGSLVLDPFAGSGTTILVADMLHRNAIGLELNPNYVTMARNRVSAPRSDPEALRRAQEDEGQITLFPPS